jgi:hypothetical protein
MQNQRRYLRVVSLPDHIFIGCKLPHLATERPDRRFPAGNVP